MTKKVIQKKPNESKKAMWLGAQRLMEKPQQGTKEEKERKLILLTSRVLGVSPFGVNILGGLPYINKLGLAQKAQQYDSKVQFRYEWVNLAKDDTEKAICKCKIVSGDKELTDWIVGECSPSTQKMGTLKGYQNHMAQTRAKNRAIHEVFGVKIHEEMMENIDAIYKWTNATEEQKDAVKMQLGGAASTSAEEIATEKGAQEQRVLFSEDNDIAELKKLAREHGAPKGMEKQFIEQKIGHNLDLAKPTKKYISMMKAQFLAAVVKK